MYLLSRNTISVKMLCVFVVISLCIFYTHGYSMGPPPSVCQSLYPVGHGESAQTSTIPYSISVNATIYSPIQVVEVRVNTTDNDQGIAFFEGMMAQVRRVNCKHPDYLVSVGHFSLSPNEDFLGLMDCNGNTASSVNHMNHSHIHDRVFYWHAPPTPVGHVKLVATVVRRKVTFWTDIHSTMIIDPTSDEDTSVCSGSYYSARPTFVTWVLVAVAIVFSLYRRYA